MLACSNMSSSAKPCAKFEGARTQLVEMTQQKQDVIMLDSLKEKSFSALTTEERGMLKNLTAKKT